MLIQPSLGSFLAGAPITSLVVIAVVLTTEKASSRRSHCHAVRVELLRQESVLH